MKNGKSKTVLLITKLIFILHFTESNSSEDNFYKEPLYDKLFFARNINCSSNNCPGLNECVFEKTTCKCSVGFANLDSLLNSQQVPFCKYIRKKQLAAFLLQMFLFSTGQFYIGKNNLGLPQLILVILMVVLTLIKINLNIEREKIHQILRLILPIIYITIFIWWFVDIIIFGMNNYLDHYGIPLLSW